MLRERGPNKGMDIRRWGHGGILESVGPRAHHHVRWPHDYLARVSAWKVCTSNSVCGFEAPHPHPALPDYDLSPGPAQVQGVENAKSFLCQKEN